MYNHGIGVISAAIKQPILAFIPRTILLIVVSLRKPGNRIVSQKIFPAKLPKKAGKYPGSS